MSSREDPIDRPTSRVLLLDEFDRVLLFRALEPDQETRRPFWFPPGGGLEAGETHEEAAVREVRAETGFEIIPGPCVWLRSHVWRLEDRWYRSIERYFLARTPAADVLRDAWTELELQLIGECRWWSAADIHDSSDTFAPRRLAELLPPLLRGEVPPAPFEVGV